ncbi:Uncharacterised protein [Enterobacter hormaechei]|nr:Uncharacterised protein [Enterobacter hormaechei]VAG49065.1 Uncharacterised protein [Enterobacter hormaechei]
MPKNDLSDIFLIKCLNTYIFSNNPLFLLIFPAFVLVEKELIKKYRNIICNFIEHGNGTYIFHIIKAMIPLNRGNKIIIKAYAETFMRH